MLVAFAGWVHPVPCRTRQLSAPAPMVLRLTSWESRSLPTFIVSTQSERTGYFLCSINDLRPFPAADAAGFFVVYCSEVISWKVVFCEFRTAIEAVIHTVLEVIL